MRQAIYLIPATIFTAAILALPVQLAGQTPIQRSEQQPDQQPPDSCNDQLRYLNTDKLRIETRSGRQHRIYVYLAQTNAQRGKGLMCVRQMPDDTGMLFWYQRPRVVSMWMKNTYIPLDMLFVQDTGRILNIAENTTPHSLDSVAATGIVSAVIELNGGTVSRLRIQSGDIVAHPLFQPESIQSETR